MYITGYLNNVHRNAFPMAASILCPEINDGSALEGDNKEVADREEDDGEEYDVYCVEVCFLDANARKEDADTGFEGGGA